MNLFSGHGTSFGDSDESATKKVFANHLSPITIFWKESDKVLIIKRTICVTDT